MKIKKIVIGMIVAMAAFVGQAESSAPFRLSLKSDGVRTSLGDEMLTYSSRWDGSEGATVTIAQDCAVVADSLSGEGSRPWSVTRNGTYVLTHTTYTNGVAGMVETATFVVTGKDIPFAVDDVTVAGFAGKYDGAAHGVGVTVKEGIEDVVVRYAAGDGAPALPWSETSPMITDVGSMTVWCEIAAPGYITQTNSATVVISSREVTLTSGSASKVYDGTALVNGNVTVGGDGFVDGEGASYNVTGSQMNVGESENAFAYTLNDNTKAGNYNITTVNGTLTVTKANVGGGIDGGEEPGDGEVPQGGVSKFDASFVYDGEGHTIDTNALVAAFGSVMIGDGVIKYAADISTSGALGTTRPITGWNNEAPVYTNAGEYVVWYEVTNPNYNDFTHAAKVTITKRDATLTSGSASKVYDGLPLQNTDVTISGDGFVDGEGATFGNFAFQGVYGSSDNDFSYWLKSGTKAANYNIVCERGILTVTDPGLSAVKQALGKGLNPATISIDYYSGGVSSTSHDGVGSYCASIFEGSGGQLEGEKEVLSATVTGPCKIIFYWSAGGDGGEVYATGKFYIDGQITETIEGSWGAIDASGYGLVEVDVCEGIHRLSWSVLGHIDAPGRDHYAGITVDEVEIINKGIGQNGEEPGEGEVPSDGISKFDITLMYDGKGHTINTNALVAVTIPDSTPSFAYALTENGPWQTDLFVFTNVCTTSYWYKISAENYSDYIHAAKLTITNRHVTITSGNGTWMYDGLPHSNDVVIAEGFVDGEGVTTNNFATILNVGTVANAFDYDFINNTLAGNYNITCVTGVLSVVAAEMDNWTDEAKWSVTLSGNNAKYDGMEKTCEVTAIAYDGVSVPTYTVTGNKATDAGDYTLTVTGTGNFSGSHTFKWSIAKRDVTLTSGSSSKIYDSSALVNQDVTVGGDGFVDGEGATFKVTGSQTNVGESENAFTYTFSNNTKASNYNITTVNGRLTVTKANVGSGTDGGEEPGAGEMPQGGVSKFDASFVYDGEGHTIATNALTAAFSAVVVGETTVEYALDDGSGDSPTLPWVTTAPAYTNAGEYIVWYRVTNPNYNEFIHAAKVAIMPRTGVVVDIVGNVATNMYNGAAQSIDGYTVAINDSLYKETDFEFAGNSYVSGTAAGKYPMGLLASQFSNKTKNFADVTFNVMDGELVILEPAQKNVILVAIGGTFADGTVVTQECEDVYIAFPIATREGYVFDGWYLGITNGAPKAAAGASLLVDDDHALFAKWSIDETLMPGGASIFAWEAIDANAVKITGFKDSGQKVSTLLLPDMIEGRLVTEIATGAFANSKSGMTKLVLPVFCTKIGDKAFMGVASLSEIVFADVRRWDAPSEIGSLAIGRYAFTGAGVEAVTLPKAVGAIGDYAFANCRKLANLTILGIPTIGVMPLRRVGLDVGGVTVHLDPALANDSAYMETLKQECGNVTVRADAIVTRMTLSSLAVSAREIELSVSVEKAASWGKVDLSLVKVAYRESLSEKPIMLDPSSVTENADGSLTVKVVAPKGNSGFFQVVLENK